MLSLAGFDDEDLSREKRTVYRYFVLNGLAKGESKEVIDELKQVGEKLGIRGVDSGAIWYDYETPGLSAGLAASMVLALEDAEFAGVDLADVESIMNHLKTVKNFKAASIAKVV